MELFDAMIRRIEEKIVGHPCVTYRYDDSAVLEEEESFTMVFGSDTAAELGSTDKNAVNLTCVTSDPDLVTADEIRLLGPDIKDIKGSSDYARIVEVLVRDDSRDSNSAHKLLQDLDFVKFHIYPKDIMIRTSGQSSAERLRISQKAIGSGITFEKLGNTYISHYKKDSRVLAVRITFVTAENFDYSALEDEAKLCVSVRNSLSLIQKGLPKDCDMCTISDICGEIEGLKKLHFG